MGRSFILLCFLFYLPSNLNAQVISLSSILASSYSPKISDYIEKENTSFVSLVIDIGGTPAPSNFDICNADIVLDANFSGGPAPHHYQWFKDVSPITGATSLSYTLTPAEVNVFGTDYFVVAYDISNVVLAVSNTVSVYAQAIPVITYPSVPSFCTASSVTLTANTSSGILGYQWYRAPATPLGTAMTENVSIAGDYYVVASYSCGNLTSATVTITESTVAPSSLVITSSDASNRRCTGSSLQLNSTITGSGISYQWYRNSAIPANLIAGATNSTFTVDASELLPITYILTASNGCGNTSQSIVISPDAPPTSVQLLAPTPSNVICNGFLSTLQTTNLVNTGSAITKYEWYEGATLVSTTTIGLLNVTLPGTYTVKAYNKCGVTPSSNAQTITVVKSPTTASITYISPLLLGCSVNSVRLFANSDGSPNANIIYQWYKDGLPIATGNFYDAVAIGSYTIDAKDNLGCNVTTPLSTAVQVQNVAASPQTITLQSNTANACLGSVDFTANSTGDAPLTYAWYKDNALFLTSSLNVLNVTQSGSYKVQTSNICGISPFSNEISVTIVVGGLVKPTITLPQGTNVICQGASATLQSNTPNTGLSYRWFKDRQLIQGANTPTFQATQSGSYVVETSNNLCSILSDSIRIYINDVVPVVVNYTGRLKFCEGDSLVFTAISGDNTIQYEWFKENTSLKTGKDYTAKDAGNYTILLKAKNTCGLSKEYSFRLEVTPTSKPTVIQDGQLLRVEEQSDFYQWRFNGLPVIGANQSSFKPIDAGNYSVVLTSTGGCVRVSDEITVEGLDIEEIVWIYPNPNEGNFYIDILGKEPVSIYIFDNFGRLVYEKNIIKDKTTIFNGQINLVNFLKGTYIVKVNANGKVGMKKIIVY